MENSTRAAILEKAKELTTGPRDELYGSPWQNHTNVADLWSAYLAQKFSGKIPGHDNLSSEFILTAQDAAIMMALLKIARMTTGTHEDHFIDAAAYIAIAAECAVVEGTLE